MTGNSLIAMVEVAAVGRDIRLANGFFSLLGAGRLIQCISPLGHLTCLALSWDGQTAVVGGSEGHVWVVNTQELQDKYEPVLTTDSKGVNVRYPFDMVYY